MLVEFSVENHRAFRERQTFSMVGNSSISNIENQNFISTGFSSAPYVVKAACLFGANGSGKSSLISAIGFMTSFVRNSTKGDVNDEIDLEPFLFHSDWSVRPSEFEAVYIQNDTLYRYGFLLDNKRVYEEWLFARPRSTGRERMLFFRTYSFETDSYEWSINPTFLKGERDSWKAQTRQNALFLSTAVQLNAYALQDAYNWFTKQVRFWLPSTGGGYENIYPDVTAKMILKEDSKQNIISFLKNVDVELSDISVKEENFIESATFSLIPQALQDLMKDKLSSQKSYDVSFCRLDESGNTVPIPFHAESSGTKVLFELVGPVFNVLQNGYILIVDELNMRLHPLAFQYLISLFGDVATNPKNAQLIFTTHDTTVSNSGYLDREHIWLVEKNSTLASRLIPLSDFKIKNVKTFQKNYLQGRFGGVPKLVR
jgi:uncharacterized protein